jgi:putative endopeptidase
MRNILLAATAVALVSIPTDGKSPAPARDKENAPKPTTATAENYLDQFVDRSVSPRDDFFHFAVGKWLKAHPIPPSEKSWGISHVVQDETYNRVLALNRAAAVDKAAASGSNQQKIGDFWSAGMDEAGNAKQGFAPLAPEFERIAAVKDQRGLLETVAHLQHIGVNAMFSLYIFQDEKNSDRYALHLYQGGLGLPNRDYYFDTDSRSTMLRAEYVKHVSRMFVLLGDDATRAKANADTVMRLETELAGASRKLEDLRDPQKNYNAMSLDEITAVTPSIKWREFLEAAHMTGIDGVIVGQPEFFKQVETSLGRQSVDNWKIYLRWLLAHTFADKAGGKFDAENFHFFGTILNGTPKQRERFKRVLDAEEECLGDALGQLYVQRYFTPQAKERYTKLTGEVFTSMGEHIRALDWMTAPTKERALGKLATVVKKVGYPDHWRDYSAYSIDRSSHLMNVVRGKTWLIEYAIGKLHEPVDRTEWYITPQTYNAYYNASNNEIVLPAAQFILPGIDDVQIDDAIVYGYAAASTIGHELTHGFDDEGRQFDERGNLKEWWTKEDADEFTKRAAGIVKQFNDYIAVGDTHVNGKATQGENIADLGGINIGWDAFKKTDQYKSGKTIGGFTPAQRYFIGWAISWMNQIRPENLAVRVKTDVHAPSFLRVTGPVTNMVPFYEAFGVKPGDKMYRADDARVKIW